MDLAKLRQAIFKLNKQEFNQLALEVFKYQSENCLVYKQFLELIELRPSKINNWKEIPHLPIEFYKNFKVQTGNFEPEMVFESSSTGGQGVSTHAVKALDHYVQSFTQSFNCFFGHHADYCHLALLPSYLERKNSSLITQVNYFIAHSRFSESAFFLHDYERLIQVIQQLLSERKPIMLWGVSFALLDLAEKHPFPMPEVKLIETGGMKGKRHEMVREELHDILKEAFACKQVMGEYGMTELMSQAYAVEKGLYRCPPWMRVHARQINDPFSPVSAGRHGALNICDLSNLDSCAFIASADLGKVFDDGSFEVLGRIDHSDTRGCNLMFS